MKYFNTLLFVMVSVFIYAQKESVTTNRFYYVLKYMPSKSDTVKATANFVLDIDGNTFVFRDYFTISQDTLVAKGLKYLKQTGENNMEKLGVKESDFSFKIFKTPTETVTTDRIGFDTYQYPETEKISWHILPETKSMFGLKCQKAETNAFGRKLAAWFTVDFPYSDGPYKFSGLPGLIVDIADEEDEYHFSFTGNKNNLPKQKYLWDALFANNSIEASKEKFLKIERDFKQNPYANYDQKIENNPEQRKVLDDMKKSMAEYYSKFDNPLERSSKILEIPTASAKIRIVSEEGKPVAFAKVGYNNTQKGSFSDKNGEFVLPGNSTNQKIKIEIPGYEETEVNSVEIRNSTITLPYKRTKIEEVLLHPKKYKIVTLGYSSKSKSIHLDYLSKNAAFAKKNYTADELEKPSAEVAIPISLTTRGKIQKIKINLAKFETDENIPVRFIIYTDDDGKPGKIVNDEDLLFEMNKGVIADNTAVFDVTKHNLFLQSGKYYISFQPLTRDFAGQFFISAGLLGSAFTRNSTESWRKFPASFVPAINVVLKVEK